MISRGSRALHAPVNAPVDSRMGNLVTDKSSSNLQMDALDQRTKADAALTQHQGGANPFSCCQTGQTSSSRRQNEKPIRTPAPTSSSELTLGEVFTEGAGDAGT